MKLEDYARNLRPLEDEVRVEKWQVNEPLDGWYRSMGVGKPGCIGHLRKGKLHALDMGDHWRVHREKVDPAVNPIGHLLVDAPEVAIGLGALALIGLALGSD